MDSIYLCFYGDGPLFDNTYLSVAYPSGYSYIRPFRYRDQWLQPQLLKEMKKVESREKLVGQKAILSMRFLAKKYQWLILPIREARITHIDYRPNNHSVYFTLGPMVDFRKLAKLIQGCVEIPKFEREGLSGGELFLRSSVEGPVEVLADNVEEDYAWSTYSDKIAKDQTVPVHESARKSMFMRLSRINSKKTVNIEQIYESISMGNIYGPVLEEGGSYEIELLHRVPSLIGLNKTMEHLPIDYKAQTGNIELSRSEDDYGSNYQTHTIIATAKQRSGAIEELVIKPRDYTVTKNSKILAYVDKLQVELKIKFSFWYRLRTQFVPFIVLVLALLLLNVIGEQNGGIETITGKGILSIIISVVIIYAKERI